MKFEIFEICAIIIVLSAIFGYVNVKLLKLPNTIGLMIVAIFFTAALLAISPSATTFSLPATAISSSVRFSVTSRVASSAS